MKRFLQPNLFFIIFLSFLAACKSDPHYRIGISQCSEDDWRKLMNGQIEREIMFHPEATVEIISADDDNEKQIADIRYFMDNDFDIIVVAPNEADALTPVISEAYDRGIPVLVFDRNIHGDKYTAFQGADNAAIGRQAARYAATLLPGGGTVMELRGLPGATPTEERGRGFAEEARAAGKLDIIASATARWNYEEAVRVADSLLSLYPDVSLIYAHNDRMAIGAHDAAAKKGLHPYIIGIDGAPEIGMKAVKEGIIDATFFYPTEGQQLVRTAIAILEGTPYERNKLIGASPAIDSSNVDLLLHQTAHINNETEHLKLLKGEVDEYWTRHSSQTAFLYAAIAVLVLVCAVLFLVLRSFWQNRRHQEELLGKNRLLEEQRDLEKELNGQLAAATQSKLNFFTNVSHDLRTPLTLIAEPVEQVSKASNLTPRQQTLMRIADKNVKILQRLINQILDFRKFENDKLTLNPEEGPPTVFVREWAESFQALANKRHIDYKVEIEVPESFTMAFDVEKIERIVFNLLSNAFKYTPVKGEITVRLWQDGDRLSLSVTDTGKGISVEDLKHIFDRFYQVEKVRPEGSGIGLSLAKAFAELHDGTITAESQEGMGSVFTLSLPVRHVENAVEESMIAASRETARATAFLLDSLDDELPAVRGENDGKPLLLVIDDNDDVRLLIRELLGDTYNIIGASDGKEGIKLATRYVPDVIICDVMMTGMDGMETCSAIKNEITTSHIPVLMLTACSLDEQRAEGFERGADGYMAKPFNSEVLRSHVASLIANRRRIKEVMGDKRGLSANSEASHETRKDVEDDFYSRFLKVLTEEMGNMDLSVDALADRMKMGRSQFYRKIKALTGLSPVELLRDIRLKKARELLLTTDKTVSEICYEVGFSNPAYFTKCYREVYSETPTALRERMRSE